MTEAIPEQEPQEAVIDEAAADESKSVTYTISWYGADYTVDSLVKRLESDAFYVPSFQRLYVWTKKQASRFIESLLLGLPIPSVFVAKEADGRHMIVDGQQRLKTLQFFHQDRFGEGRFRLTEVDPRWEGRSIKDLDPEDRMRLDDSIIPTIVFKQDAPEEDDTSIYHVFERLNTGGTKLTPQEVRNCVDAGDFVDFLHHENLENSEWREIAGGVSKRCKDQELILRFLAFYYAADNYARPMKDFLNKFSHKNRRASKETIEEFRSVFKSTISFVHSALGTAAFRPDVGLNAAVFDAVMYGVAKNRKDGKLTRADGLVEKYFQLLGDEQFFQSYKISTADETQVQTRLAKAVEFLTD